MIITMPYNPIPLFSFLSYNIEKIYILSKHWQTSVVMTMFYWIIIYASFAIFQHHRQLCGDFFMHKPFQYLELFYRMYPQNWVY